MNNLSQFSSRIHSVEIVLAKSGWTLGRQWRLIDEITHQMPETITEHRCLDVLSQFASAWRPPWSER